jgi:molecular chaperone DnaK (HSP70)
VDLGTTYTGAAFARVSDNRVADLERDIALVADWGATMANARKIPTVVSYSPPSSKKERQFGSHLSDDAVVMVNTKLELDVQSTRLAELESLLHALQGMSNLNFRNVQHCNGRPSYTGKTPETIITYYLTKVYEAFSRYLEVTYGAEATRSMRSDMVTTLVITVPAVRKKWYQVPSHTD